MRILLFGLILIGANPLAAQLQRVMHQSFTLDTAHVITFELPGNLSVETWAGDNILVETKAQLYDASEGILNHFIEKGRYKLEAELQADTLRVTAFDPKRDPIKTLKGECSEVVVVRFFIPDTFSQADSTRWVRPRKAPPGER